MGESIFYKGVALSKINEFSEEQYKRIKDKVYRSIINELHEKQIGDYENSIDNIYKKYVENLANDALIIYDFIENALMSGAYLTKINMAVSFVGVVSLYTGFRYYPDHGNIFEKYLYLLKKDVEAVIGASKSLAHFFINIPHYIDALDKAISNHPEFFTFLANLIMAYGALALGFVVSVVGEYILHTPLPKLGTIVGASITLTTPVKYIFDTINMMRIKRKDKKLLKKYNLDLEDLAVKVGNLAVKYYLNISMEQFEKKMKIGQEQVKRWIINTFLFIGKEYGKELDEENVRLMTDVIYHSLSNKKIRKVLDNMSISEKFLIYLLTDLDDKMSKARIGF